MRNRRSLLLLALLLITSSVRGSRSASPPAAAARASGAATPVQHLVVIFQENRSFDHYFGAYPVAANPPGEPPFAALADTPSVNGFTETLRNHNPNGYSPFRIDSAHSYTCDHTHEYLPEQQAYNSGLLDKFLGLEVYPPESGQYCPKDDSGDYTIVMGYHDGNTVTALWNYAQHFALSDNFFGTTFGPSSVGAMHIAAADTAPVLCGPPRKPSGDGATVGDAPVCGPNGATPNANALATNISDPNPLWDVCSGSDATKLTAMAGRNLGDLLTTAGVTWGWFQGGFTLSDAGTCESKHVRAAYDHIVGIDPATDANAVPDYQAHHEPFQYYSSTANPRHLPPSSVDMVGLTDQANHQYDLTWFWQAAETGRLPAVSFLKAAAYQDGHPGYSDPLDEQQFLAETINRLQRLSDWASTAVIIAYDDSGGWYDHVMPPIVNHSQTAFDVACGSASMGAPARCGYGPRLPLLVISPFAKQNYVSHVLIDQTSITRFVEDNWLGGQRISTMSFDNVAGSLSDLFAFDQPPAPRLLLDPVSGQVTPGP